MSTTIETFDPSALSRADSISTPLTPAKTVASAGSKQPKLSSNFQRIDFEPLYTDLKAQISSNWGIYHDALTRFVRGELSSAEFCNLTDAFLLIGPSVEHAHNALVCAILHNTTRDVPDVGPAAWVSAVTDKPASAATSKPNIASDAGEQRLKVEVMALPARDRRRLKGIGTDKADEDSPSSRLRNEYEEYFQAGKIRVPDFVPASAGGLNKTNWDLEIRKRYTQPLFSETLEFPDAATIFARMMPICYEESVAAGSSMHCAELVSIAAESFVKDFLATVYNRTRSNGPKYENGAGGGVFTAKYSKQLQKEEQDFRAGKIQRGRENGLLPVEAREASSRTPLAIGDLKVAGSVSRGLWGGMPLIGSRIGEGILESELEDWKEERAAEKAQMASMNIAVDGGEDAMDIDEDDYGWEGGGAADREALGSLLQDCLAIRA